MNAEDLDILSGDNAEQISNTLKTFNEKNAKLFDFTQFNSTGQWPVIWKSVFNILRKEQSENLASECLSCIRILSRDKLYLNSNIDNKSFDCLLGIACLSTNKMGALLPDAAHTTDVAVEALKCLCNMVFQSLKCQDMCAKNSAVEGILKRVKSDQSFPYEIEYFDMKLLFLITALNVETRTKVRDDLNGLTYLTQLLDVKIKESDRTEQQIDLICEILKVLFNITVNSDTDGKTDEQEIQHRRLVSIVRDMLIISAPLSEDRQYDLVSNGVNLLTNIPTICMSELAVGKSTAEKISDSTNIEVFEGKCMLAVEVVLKYLKKKLDDIPKSPGQYELLAPVLIVLVRCVRSNITLRHYIRSIVLPPLKDVYHRPEEGNEIRNHLCRFLTIPEKSIRELTAELLFVCCKENVSRMIKHTGYGNAAGLLASRGLLGGRVTTSLEYSSDSEDSDTEEYKQLQHGINPVLGCYEPPRPNPLEGMSDEQKEYEANKLANLMDQLHRQGIVQPCRIGDDGRPQPVEHILELQDELQQQQIDHKRKT